MTKETTGGYSSAAQEKWKYDSARPYQFEEHLVENGYDFLRRTENKFTISVPPGKHELVVGFSEVDLESKTYHYGNNSLEFKEKPLILDYKHPAFQNLMHRFVTNLKGRKPFIETTWLLLILLFKAQSALDQPPKRYDA